MSADSHFSKDQFVQNLNTYAKVNGKVAEQIAQIDPSLLIPFQSRDGQWNLKQVTTKKDLYLHSPASPVQEAKKWAESLSKTDAEVVYVYGVGLGYYYDAAREWLDEKPGRFIIFLEDNLSVLRRFFETEKANQVLKDKRVQIHYFTTLDSAVNMIQWLTWFFVMSRIEVLALRSYKENREEIYFTLRLRLGHESLRCGHLAREYLSYSAPFYRNFYRNNLLMGESFHGNKLFKQFAGVPAIICGAGPSLNKNIEVLKGLKDRALIFSGGSSINILDHNNLEPNFGSTIDPNFSQRDRLWRSNFFNTPYFYRGRVYHLALCTVHGPRLYVNGTGGYGISQWFEDRFDIKDKVIDEGHNVINFSTEIAHHMGCNPIIFVGMDLAYTDGQVYGDGLIDKDENSLEKQSIIKRKNAVFPRLGVDGKEVMTEWKWVTESEWIGSYAKNRPETTFINATEGGLGMDGSPNKTLKEVKISHLRHMRDLDGLVLQKYINHPLKHITFKEMNKAVNDLRDSIQRCYDLHTELLKEIAKEVKKQNKSRFAREIKENSHILKLDKQIQEQIAHRYLFHAMAEVKHRITARQMLQVEGNKKLKTERQRAIERLDVNKEKFTYLRNCAEFNLSIIDSILQEFEGRGFDVIKCEEETKNG